MSKKRTGGKRGRPSTWPAWMVDYLKENIGTMAAKKIGWRIDKSMDAVRSKARTFGLSSALICREARKYTYRHPTRPNPPQSAELPSDAMEIRRVQRMMVLAGKGRA